MLGRLAGFFNATPAPKILPSFTERLKKLGYDFDLIPAAFCDAITFELMNNPMMVDKIPDFRLDANQLVAGMMNPFSDQHELLNEDNTSINTALVKKIEHFISQVEAIETLQTQLKESQHADTAVLFENCSLTQKEKKRLHIEQIHNIRKNLLVQVNEFIHDTSDILESGEMTLEAYLMLREDLRLKVEREELVIIKLLIEEKIQHKHNHVWESVRDSVNARDNIAYLKKLKHELKTSLQAMHSLMTTDGMNEQEIATALAPQAAELLAINEILKSLKQHKPPLPSTLIPGITSLPMCLFAQSKHSLMPLLETERKGKPTLRHY